MVKRALLIGCNYTGTPDELGGCVADVERIEKLLDGYEVTKMLDTKARVSKISVLRAMRKFATSLKSGDIGFFHFSGHGGSIKDQDGDEKDRKDEVIWVSDGMISDDQIHKNMIRHVGHGAHMFMLLDSCHSGTGADLKYNFDEVSVCNGRLRSPSTYRSAEWSKRYKERKNLLRRVSSKGSVVCVSGCRDAQTSAETVAIPGGAMTGTFIAAWEHLRSKRSINLRTLHHYMACVLRCSGYDQVPQVSCSSPDVAKMYRCGRATITF